MTLQYIISLLSSISKIIERVVHRRLYSFLDVNDILYKNQFGFRRKHSTIDAVTKFVTDISRSLDDRESTLAVYLDLSKAFDTINHSILKTKLEFYGVRGQALDWFSSYLSNRKQYVSYMGSNSTVQNISCGVPQGSVLGPLLFIIYTNDLPNCLNQTKSILFADDTTIYLSSNDIPNLFTQLNQELQMLTDWFRANKLSLNVAKTNYMLFTYSSQQIDPQIDIHLANSSIKRAKCAKFLGIYIDEKLKWDEHIYNMNKKISKSFFAIRKARHVLSRKHLTTLYYSLVYPYLAYGVTLWGSTYPTHLSKIIIRQKKVVRIIAGAHHNAHTAPIFRNMSLLKLEDIYKLQVSRYVFSYIAGLLPPALSQLFTLSQDTHGHSTRHALTHKLRVQKTRTVAASQCIHQKGPLIWNSIHPDMYIGKTDLMVSISCFSRRFKRSALENYDG